MVRRDWLSLDLRALAVYRVVLGVMAILDLLSSGAEVRAFFCDSGILPRLSQTLPLASRWLAAFQGSGEAWPQLLWIGLGVVCALLVLLGKHTRLACFWLWYLLASLHLRNSLAADRGAMLLELMCFWGLWLPLEARWSLTARQFPQWKSLPDCFRSAGTVALYLQISMLYFFSAVLKNGVAWVVDCNAAQVACRSAQVSTAYSEWLAQFTLPLQWGTLVTVLGEALIPLFLLSPIAHQRLRLATVLGLLAFHLHNQMLFRLGFFPLMNAGLVLVLLPSSWWDRWSRPARGESVAVQPLPAGYQLLAVTRAWLVLCLAYCFYCNWQTFPKPRKAHLDAPMRSFGKFFRLEQYWNLFSPSPPNDLWFRLLARQSDGRQVDLLRRDRRVTLEREVSPMASVPSHRWQMVFLNSVYKEDPALSQSIVAYWERTWGPSYQDFRYEVVTRDFDPHGRPLTPQVRRLWPLEERVGRVRL